VRAALHFFRNQQAEAEACLTEAETLAQEQRCLWVSFAAARLRAHMYRFYGNEQAALDQARIAALWAEQSGQFSRLLRIREEFATARPLRPMQAAGAKDGPRAPSSLTALVHMGQANSRELRPERQAHLILGEVLDTLKAERALLFMRELPENSLRLRAARNASGVLDGDATYDTDIVHRVFATEQTKICNAVWATDATAHVERPCIVVPLVLREQAVGVLYLDRSEAAGDFGAQDAALLQELANQVPIAIELASALRAREELENHLEGTQKMDAVGRLVGGVAHDFNNVLTAIQLAADSLGQTASSAAQRSDLQDIVSSAGRGAELAHQLLAFARGGQAELQHFDLGDLLRKLHPALLRLTALDVELDLQVELTPCVVLANALELERALMNLCRNANDAMPTGGRLQVSLRPLQTNSKTSCRAQLREDRSYVELSVSDTGIGISEEVRAHLFEPFFTTKARGYGTGLGLSNVYAIVQQCDGQIDVSSELGVGTTFRIYLPLAPEGRADSSEHEAELVWPPS
jgi:signal transduction histidine kinase